MGLTDYIDAPAWGTGPETSATVGAARLDIVVPPDDYHVSGLQLARFRTFVLNASAALYGGRALKVTAESSSMFSVGEYGVQFSTTAMQAAINGTLYTVPSFTGAGTKGDLLTYSTTWTRLSVGIDGLALVADSVQPTGLTWAAPKALESANYTWTGTHAFNGATVGIGDASTDTLTITSSVANNVIFVKEANHAIRVDTSTTAATAGGDLTVASGNGNGAPGGSMTLDTGTGTAGGPLGIGTTLAASITVGRSGITTTINGVLAPPVVASEQTGPGVPVVYIFDIGDVAGNTDIVIDRKMEVFDCVVVKANGAGGAGDTVQIFNGAAAITNAVSLNAVAGAIVRPSSIDTTNFNIAAAGTLRATIVDGNAGATDLSCLVYIHGILRS